MKLSRKRPAVKSSGSEASASDDSDKKQVFELFPCSFFSKKKKY